MAGRITFKDGRHPSRVAEFFQDENLTDSDIEDLGCIVGRQITPDERIRLDDLLNEVLFLRKSRSDYREIRSQDVQETLRAMGRLKGKALTDAFNHCDERTHAALHGALHRMGASPYRMGAGEFEGLRPDCIQAAALLALADLSGAEGGRPENAHRKYLAEGVLCIWADMTGERQPKAWVSPETEEGSPIVKIACILLARIGERIDPSGMVKNFRKVIA